MCFFLLSDEIHVSLSIYLGWLSSICFDENRANHNKYQLPLQPAHSLLVCQDQGSVHSSIKSWKCQRSLPRHHPRSVRSNISATVSKSGLNVAANISAEAVITRVWRNGPETEMCYFTAIKMSGTGKQNWHGTIVTEWNDLGFCTSSLNWVAHLQTGLMDRNPQIKQKSQQRALCINDDDAVDIKAAVNMSEMSCEFSTSDYSNDICS